MPTSCDGSKKQFPQTVFVHDLDVVGQIGPVAVGYRVCIGMVQWSPQVLWTWYRLVPIAGFAVSNER